MGLDIGHFPLLQQGPVRVQKTWNTTLQIQRIQSFSGGRNSVLSGTLPSIPYRQNFSADKIFSGQPFSADKILRRTKLSTTTRIFGSFVRRKLFIHLMF